MDDRLSHLDESGAARMVDVSGKASTKRTAVAEAVVEMSAQTLELLFEGRLPKGDALATARLAGIMAAKRTADLIPLCHPIPVTSVVVDLNRHGQSVLITTTVTTTAPTGVEMEAMTAAAIAALTLYDMVKGVERGVTVSAVRLLSKSGGRSGEWTR